MRALAKVLDRFDETVRAFEIRQEIRDHKRDRQNMPRLKALRDQRKAEAAYIETCRRNARKLKRDAYGQFVPKRAKAVNPAQ